MHPAIAMMKEAGTVNILSDRITMEYALEKMSKGFPKTMPSAQTGSLKLGLESSALIFSSELSIFITASQFSVNALTDIWDSKEGTYQYGTRGKGEYNINNPCVNLLGGSAQEWLVKSIPSDAVGGGFTRRVNFVLATKKDKKVPWPTNSHFATPILADDLRQISLLRGEFQFTSEARRIFEDYYNSCEPDEFDDEATSVYKTSKWANASKLAQVISVSRSDDLVISKDDLQGAIDKTEEVAGDLRIVFRSVGESEMADASEHVIKFMEYKGYVSRNDILRHNWRHFTSNELDVIIATFREAGMILERSVGTHTLYAWKETEGKQKP